MTLRYPRNKVLRLKGQRHRVSKCIFQHKSKTKDPKVVKLGTENYL